MKKAFVALCVFAALVLTAPLWGFELLAWMGVRGVQLPALEPELPARLVDAIWALEEPATCREPAAQWGGLLVVAAWRNTIRPGPTIRPEDRPCGSWLARSTARAHLPGQRYPNLRVVRRGLRDTAVAAWLSRHANRAQLASAYARSASFGRGAIGLDAGAHAWFGKSAAELDLPQLALLLGMAWQPLPDARAAHRDQARRLRGEVVTRWRKAGFIDDAQMTEALRAEPERTLIDPPL